MTRRLFALIPALALALYAVPAHAQAVAAPPSAPAITLTAVTTPAEALVADSAKAKSDVESGAAPAVIAADAAKIAADLNALTTAVGVPAETKIIGGKYRLDWSLGGGPGGGIAFPASAGVSGSGSGCLTLDAGMAKATAAPGDRYHLELNLCEGALASGGHSVAATSLLIGPAYQPALNSPLYGVEFALMCQDSARLQNIKQACIPGVSTTTAFAALLGTVGVGAP